MDMKTPLCLLLPLLFLGPFSTIAQDFPGVPYGPEPRQFMDIYLAPSDCPTPVYFDAHGNGGTTTMPSAIVNDLLAAGISIVAWESFPSITTPTEVETGWEDAELMFAWVKANAATYNFDTTQFIVGGSSRGSILSWKYGHSTDPSVLGLYMYNALPDGVWVDSTWWYAPNEVTVDSPPLFFVYRWEPGVVDDSHDPENGFIIMDTYDALGIGDRDTMIHSIQYTDNNDRYQFLVEFAESLIEPCQIVSTSAAEYAEPAYTAFPNPFQEQIFIAGLKGEEYFVLRTANGAILQETTDVEALGLSALPGGMYFLSIRMSNSSSVLRLIKK